MEFILVITLIVGIIIVLRLVGAWMLRIDEVIKLLKEIRDQLRINNMS